MPLPFQLVIFTAALRKPGLILFNYFSPGQQTSWIKDIPGSLPNQGILDAQCNGSATTFTLPATATSLMVFWNGVFQEGGGVDYTFNSPAGTFTMVQTPLTGDQLVVQYS